VIAHQLTAPGGLAMPAIRTEFGAAFVTAEGAMDRAKMREYVFSNPLAKKRLERILHPLIRSVTERAALQAEGLYRIFVVPLLVESGGWRERVSRVLVVDCPEQLQVARVTKRNKLTEQQVRAIMSTQASRQARLAAADAGSRAGLTFDEIEDLRIAVDELCHSVMRADGSGTVELVFELDDEGLVVGGVGPPIEPGGESKPSELSRTIVAAVVDEHDLDRDGDALHFRLVKRARRR